MVEQIIRFEVKQKRQKAVIAKAAILESRRRQAEALVDQDMVEIARRNSSPDMLSLVEGATFFATS